MINKPGLYQYLYQFIYRDQATNNRETQDEFTLRTLNNALWAQSGGRLNFNNNVNRCCTRQNFHVWVIRPQMVLHGLSHVTNTLRDSDFFTFTVSQGVHHQDHNHSFKPAQYEATTESTLNFQLKQHHQSMV
jgi:hypothetical protein